MDILCWYGKQCGWQIRKDYPQYKILLTFYSPSGYEVRKNYEGADIICYMPVDTRLNAIRFLRLVRPVMAFFIKYEFWSNFLHILKHLQHILHHTSTIIMVINGIYEFTILLKIFFYILL